jgi:hypothetical protein
LYSPHLAHTPRTLTCGCAHTRRPQAQHNRHAYARLCTHARTRKGREREREAGRAPDSAFNFDFTGSGLHSFVSIHRASDPSTFALLTVTVTVTAIPAHIGWWHSVFVLHQISDTSTH